MKHILLFLFCTVLTLDVQAQTFRCSFSGPTISPEVVEATTEYEKQLKGIVEATLNKIAREIGVNSVNYKAYPSSNVGNFQVEYNKAEREFVMYYNLVFLKNLHNILGHDQELYVAIYIITAHEFGHNLNGHVHSEESDPVMELEADYFAGQTAAKQGLPYVFAEKVYRICTLEYKTNTHPGQSERIDSFRKGYRNGL
jgi:hypothetical protein